jgi:DNA-binding XRE family transcriptional regulator
MATAGDPDRDLAGADILRPLDVILSAEAPEGRGGVNVTAIAVTRRKTRSSSEQVFARPGAPTNPASPRTMLADALRKLAGSPAAAVQIADRAGDDMRGPVQRARARRPINAGAYLALCGALGLDPVDGSPRPIKRVSSRLAWPMVGAGLKIMRRLRHQDQRSAAKAIGISATTLCRVESGDAASVETLLAVCKFIGTHPDNYSTT